MNGKGRLDWSEAGEDVELKACNLMMASPSWVRSGSYWPFSGTQIALLEGDNTDSLTGTASSCGFALSSSPIDPRLVRREKDGDDGRFSK